MPALRPPPARRTLMATLLAASCAVHAQDGGPLVPAAGPAPVPSPSSAPSSTAVPIPVPAPDPASAAQVNPAPAAATPVTTLERVEIKGRRDMPPAGRTSLSGSELQRMPGAGSDPMKAIQSLPGIVVNDDSSSEPAVRGARPGDNAYLVDFLPVGYVFHVGGLTSVFHPDLVRRFDLSSAAFGAESPDVVGAVFDITLRDPRRDRLGGIVDVSFLGASALVESPLGERAAFFFAARRSYFDVFTKSVEDDEEGVRFTLPVYSDYQGKLVWDVSPNQRLSLHLNGAADRLDFTVRSNSKIAQQDPVLAGNSNSRTAYRTQAVVWRATPVERISNRLAVGQTADEQTARLGSAQAAMVNVSNRFVREQLSLELGSHQVMIGGSVTQSDFDLDLDLRNARCTEFDPNCDLTSAPRAALRQRIRVNYTDAYLTDRWQFHPRWAATLGVRSTNDDYLDRRYTEPRAGLEWALAPRTTLSAAWGRHDQFPNGDQVLREIGNPLLNRVRARHGVIGLTQGHASGWSWRLEAYEKRFTDFAVADSRLNYVNGGSGASQGAELLLRKDTVAGSGGGFWSRVSGFLSLTAAQARRRNDVTGESFRFDYDQPLAATLVASWKPGGTLQYGAKWSYHTGAPFTPIVGTRADGTGRLLPVYGPINSQRLGPYHRLDLRVDRQFSERFSGYLELINAYARKNPSGFSYSADYSERKPVYQLPALLSFGVQYRL